MVRLLPLLLFFALPAHAEKLRFEVTLFGVQVGEVTAALEEGHVKLEGASAGALVLFFPAKESIDIRLVDDHPQEVVRTYDHAGEQGEWKASFRNRTVKVVHRSHGGVKKKTLALPAPVYDPATALQKLRAAAPAPSVSLMVFEGRRAHKVRFERVSLAPLHYRAVLSVPGRGGPRAKKLPTWLRLLGFGRGGTPRPEAQVWLSADAQHLPLKIRLSDPRGALELTLKEPHTVQGRLLLEGAHGAR
jgi:hypothetical protein